MKFSKQYFWNYCNYSLSSIFCSDPRELETTRQKAIVKTLVPIINIVIPPEDKYIQIGQLPIRLCKMKAQQAVYMAANQDMAIGHIHLTCTTSQY